jgi:hypothetical protein
MQDHRLELRAEEQKLAELKRVLKAKILTHSNHAKDVRSA